MSSLNRVLDRNFSTSQFATSIKSICEDLNKENNLKRLVDKFKKASEHYRFRTQNVMYEKTVRRLASAKRFKLVKDILEEQKKYGDTATEGFSARLISLYGKSGLYKSARKTFDELPDRDCPRTVLSLNALLAAYLHSSKFEMVDRLYKELPAKLSIEPDLVTYNTVIKAFCGMGSFDSAMNMVEEMEKKGINADLITFNTLLDGSYGKGRFLDGEKIWNQMDDKNVTPNIWSYNFKLMGLAMEKKPKEAVELFEKMKKEGLKPNLYSINALIKCFVNEGNLDEVKKWYSEIANTDFDPDKTTFSTLLPFLCEKGDLKTAFEVCKEIFNSRCRVDEALLQLVVDGLVRNSMISEAEEIKELGKQNGFRRYKLKLSANE